MQMRGGSPVLMCLSPRVLEEKNKLAWLCKSQEAMAEEAGGSSMAQAVHFGRALHRSGRWNVRQLLFAVSRPFFPESISVRKRVAWFQ